MSRPQDGRARAPKPNILLITTDQQRFDAAGAAAPSFLRTPHIDLLEAEGVRFASAYSDCPICVPARTTIMTGRSALSHGLCGNGKTSEVIGSDNTLPALLRQLGYQSVAIGKMHFGPQRVRHGFDEMVLPDDYYRWIEHSGYEWKPMRHGLDQLELYPGMSTVPEALSLTTWIADRCADFIDYRRDPSMPFFLWCSYSKPHPPLDPPEPYYSMYRDAPIPDPVESTWSAGEACPPLFRRICERRRIDTIDARTLREARAAYYGLVTHIDYSLGRIFAALQESGEWENTLIIYTSDHGEYLGDHGNAGKIFFHEASAHVPFVLRPPKAWREELNSSGLWMPERVDTPVSLADIVPTLVGAAGGEPPKAVDGIDVWDRLVLRDSRSSDDALGAVDVDGAAGNVAAGDLGGAAGAGAGTRYVIGTGAYETECDYFAITDGRWKYIYYTEGAVEQLFDLTADPEERHDSVSDLAGATNRPEEARAACGRLTEALLERLRSEHPEWLRENRFPRYEPKESSRTMNRRNALYSFHTEKVQKDVRH